MWSRVRWYGWVALSIPAFVLLCLPASWPRWLFMWLMTAAVYGTLKVLTLSAASTAGVSGWRIMAYLFAWPGLNAARFLSADEAGRSQRASGTEWLEGLINLIAGGLIFWSARYWVPASSPIMLGWAGMTGTVLMLHFGSFHLVSCFWRSVGVDAPPLMNRPTRATSVADFWGRRWNTAFRDVTHQFLFRPLAARWGVRVAMLMGFLFSGVLHELVISVPPGAGYGGPTIFFCLQVVAMVFERSHFGRVIGLGRGWPGWLFTCLVLLLPAPILFHAPFVTRIVIPFMQAVGAA
jgi:hypothetical protein